jgi:hypothetical protein
MDDSSSISSLPKARSISADRVSDDGNEICLETGDVIDLLLSSTALHRTSHSLARSAASACNMGLHNFLRRREGGGHRPPRRGKAPKMESAIAARIPHCLHERELDGVARCDKIFASAWLDNDRVIAGTKDNQVGVR